MSHWIGKGTDWQAVSGISIRSVKLHSESMAVVLDTPCSIPPPPHPPLSSPIPGSCATSPWLWSSSPPAQSPPPPLLPSPPLSQGAAQ